MVSAPLLAVAPPAGAETDVEHILGSLWGLPPGDALEDLVPRSLSDLRSGRERLRRFVDRFPRRLEGSVDPAVIVRGDIVAMGHGSHIEAGAVVHRSCRLVLGPGSRVGPGAVLRDDVVKGQQAVVPRDQSQDLVIGRVVEPIPQELEPTSHAGLAARCAE